jgi:hypothetical protein
MVSNTGNPFDSDLPWFVPEVQIRCPSNDREFAKAGLICGSFMTVARKARRDGHGITKSVQSVPVQLPARGACHAQDIQLITAFLGSCRLGVPAAAADKAVAGINSWNEHWISAAAGRCDPTNGGSRLRVSLATAAWRSGIITVALTLKPPREGFLRPCSVRGISACAEAQKAAARQQFSLVAAVRSGF